MKFVVLSTSRGTVLQSTIDSMQSGSLHAVCLGLVTDREDRGCVAKAKQAGLPVAIVERLEGEERESYDRRLHDAITQLTGSDMKRDTIIATMGWMRLLSPWFVRTWSGRIINVHPSLLPKHRGTHAHESVLASGDTESGMTIHFVDEGMDTGKIIIQKTCPVRKDDTIDTLRSRVQALESEWFPKVLEMIHVGEISL